MKHYLCISFLVIALGCICSTYAQQPATPADTTKVVNILHADRLGFSKKDTANPIQYGAGNVAARQNNTLFYSDSAVLNQKTKTFQAYGKVHIKRCGQHAHLWRIHAIPLRYQDGLYAEEGDAY
jgi:lipopolysaccharide assembly outer membrane protein LptD (OstA)